MLFNTFQPYDDNEIFDSYNDKCIICLTDYKLISLKCQPFFISNCICNCWVHYECLEEYFFYNKSLNMPCFCPICRTSVIYFNHKPPYLIQTFNLINIYAYLLKYFMLIKLLSKLIFTLFSFSIYIFIYFDTVSFYYYLYYNSPHVS